MLNFASGLLSRPCARMETNDGELLSRRAGDAVHLLILAMFCFGPEILEWLEDMPPEPG